MRYRLYKGMSEFVRSPNVYDFTLFEFQIPDYCHKYDKVSL